MRHNDSLGRTGEDLAAEHLTASGMTILARNWRCAEGEVDIVAAEDAALVVVEVKTRSSVRFGTPLEAVDARKFARLQRLAFAWCTQHDVHPATVRIDVVEVLAARDRPPVLTHHRGLN